MILACDWGGTYFRYTLSDLVGADKNRQNIQTQKIKIGDENFDFFDFLDNFLAKNSQKISGIGISFAGQVKDGVIISSPNLGFSNFEIEKEVRKRFNIKLRIQNDLKCAALAESLARGAKNLAIIGVGTGIGGAYYENGLICGNDNFAGEIGHIPYKKSPYPCGCGNFDCLELGASGSGLEKQFNFLGIQKKKLSQLLNSSNKQEIQIGTDFIKALSFGAKTVIALLNPSVLVLGGGILEQEPLIFEEVKATIFKEGFKPSLANLSVEKPTFQNSSIEGARLLWLG